MEFKISTEKNVITIGSGVNLGDLVNLLKKWYPQGEWKKFTIQNEPINTPYIPIYVREWWNPLPVVTYCREPHPTFNPPFELPSLPTGTYEVKFTGEMTPQN